MIKNEWMKNEDNQTARKKANAIIKTKQLTAEIDCTNTIIVTLPRICFCSFIKSQSRT